MPIDEFTAIEDRIADYRLEQRQKRLDALTTACAAGAAAIRGDGGYRPLSEEVKRRIKDRMRRWYPQPGDPIFAGERRQHGHGAVYFDCRNGFPATLELPIWLPEHQRPVILELPAERWDQTKADYDLDRVRWAQGRPVLWLQPGQPEPE